MRVTPKLPPKQQNQLKSFRNKSEDGQTLLQTLFFFSLRPPHEHEHQSVCFVPSAPHGRGTARAWEKLNSSLCLPPFRAPNFAVCISPRRHVSPRIPPPHAEEYSPEHRRVPQFLIRIEETPGARRSKPKRTGELPERRRLYLHTQLCLAREKKGA